MSSDENATQVVVEGADEVVTPEADATVEDTEAELSAEDLKKMLEKVRRENAKRRVSENETKAKLKEYDEWKASQLTEVERLKLEAEDAKKDAEEVRTENRRDKVARKYNLADDLVEFLGTGSEEDMIERAKRLAKTTESSAGTGTGSLFGDSRGTPVGAGQPSTGWLKDLFENE